MTNSKYPFDNDKYIEISKDECYSWNADEKQWYHCVKIYDDEPGSGTAMYSIRPYDFETDTYV